MKIFVEQLQHAFKSLVNNQQGSDLTIVAINPVTGKDVEIYAHSVILTARSPYFAAMLLNGNWREANERIIWKRNIDADILLVLLHYIYTADFEYVHIFNLDPFDDQYHHENLQFNMKLKWAAEELQCPLLASNIFESMIDEITSAYSDVFYDDESLYIPVAIISNFSSIIKEFFEPIIMRNNNTREVHQAITCLSIFLSTEDKLRLPFIKEASLEYITTLAKSNFLLMKEIDIWDKLLLVWAKEHGYEVQQFLNLDILRLSNIKPSEFHRLKPFYEMLPITSNTIHQLLKVITSAKVYDEEQNYFTSRLTFKTSILDDVFWFGTICKYLSRIEQYQWSGHLELLYKGTSVANFREKTRDVHGPLLIIIRFLDSFSRQMEFDFYDALVVFSYEKYDDSFMIYLNKMESPHYWVYQESTKMNSSPHIVSCGNCVLLGFNSIDNHGILRFNKREGSGLPYNVEIEVMDCEVFLVEI